jgi:hypothetical protein
VTFEKLVQIGDFFVKVSESGFERLAMIGVCCGIQIMRNPDARELQVLALLFTAQLLRALGVVAVMTLGSLAGFDLRFHVFAFPSSRHAGSLTHFAAGAGVYERKTSRGVRARR